VTGFGEGVHTVASLDELGSLDGVTLRLYSRRYSTHIEVIPRTYRTLLYDDDSGRRRAM